ncbi:hypothetical protein RJT34_20684 [Clitoria ternatea]|uniref:Uncharacterized protein n=1 Tax=Clitoria ternatea TaxID=43366 RepID=A0AAN9ITJ8_CLITE
MGLKLEILGLCTRSTACGSRPDTRVPTNRNLPCIGGDPRLCDETTTVEYTSEGSTTCILDPRLVDCATHLILPKQRGPRPVGISHGLWNLKSASKLPFSMCQGLGSLPPLLARSPKVKLSHDDVFLA